MIWPLSWFPWIIWFTWPFLALMALNVPAALAAESVWLGVIVVLRERKRLRRGRSHKVSAKP